MLEQMIIDGYGNSEDFNCSEKILNGANIAYDLGLEGDSLKMAAAFGGGMGTGSTCGAVVAALMVVGMTHTSNVAHQSPEVKRMAAKFHEMMISRMGSADCRVLKEKYWSEEQGCTEVIRAAGQLLDAFMKGDHDHEC